MHVQNILLHLCLVLMPTNARDKERTFFGLKEVKKVDSLHDDSKEDKQPVYKEKQIIRTYHHIIKKILPPYPDDLLTEESDQREEKAKAKEKKDQGGNITEKGNVQESEKKSLENINRLHLKRRAYLEYTGESYRKMDKREKIYKRPPESEQTPNAERKSSRTNMSSDRRHDKRKFREYLRHRRQRSADNAGTQHLYNSQFETNESKTHPNGFTGDLMFNGSLKSANVKDKFANPRRNKHSVRVYEGIKHLSKNTSKFVIVKNKGKTMILKPRIEKPKIAIVKHLSPWYLRRPTSFNFKPYPPKNQLVKYHVIWNPTKIITDYVPQSTLTKPLSTWYSTTVGRDLAILSPKVPTTDASKVMIANTLSPEPPWRKPVSVSNTWHPITVGSNLAVVLPEASPAVPSKVMTVKALFPQTPWRELTSVPSTFRRVSEVPTTGTSKLMTVKTLFPQSPWRKPIIVPSTWYPTTFGKDLVVLLPKVPTTDASKLVTIKPLFPQSPSIPKTTRIDLDELIRLVESYLPDGELELVTNEVKLKNELVAFHPIQSSDTSVNVTCNKLGDQERKLRISSLLLWLLSMFCLFMAVAMAFLIYITRVKDSLYLFPGIVKMKSGQEGRNQYGMFSENKETHPLTSIEEATGTDREKADVQTLLEAVQRALSECRFYQDKELTRMYSTVEHIKSMLNIKRV